jgi:hypothetical protein
MNSIENNLNINLSSFPSLSIQPFGDLRIFGVSSRLIYGFFLLLSQVYDL